MRMIRSCLGSLLIAIFTIQQSLWAQTFAPPNREGYVRDGNEYYVGRSLGEPLLTVNLLAGVKQPGVYHIPTSTDLAQLISYAGGATDNADLSRVTIHRRSKANGTTFVNVDLEDQLESKSEIPRLSESDIVLVTQKTSLDTSLRWATLISSVASIALSIAIVSDIERRR